MCIFVGMYTDMKISPATSRNVLPGKIVADSSCPWFLRFMHSLVCRMIEAGKLGTAKNYRAAMASFSRFRGGRDLRFSEVDVRLVEDYEIWLTARGMRLNSVSFHMRILRAVYRRAVGKGLTADRRPFRSVYTKIEKTVKRAISMADICRINALDLAGERNMMVARDIFMFLFCTRGMSFVDAVNLRKSDVRPDMIVYNRLKTRQRIAVGMNGHIRALIDRLSVASSDYLLPVLSGGTAEDLRRQYESALRRTNNSLNKIGRLINLEANLTTYTARHSWATIAKQKGVPTAVISDALGHDSEKTTQIYLASISSDVIDSANETVLHDLSQTTASEVV